MTAAYRHLAADDPIDDLHGAALRALERDVDRTFGDLPTVELQVLRLRFGLGVERRPLRDIARRLGVSVSTARRIELRALRSLRALSLPNDLPALPPRERPTSSAPASQPSDMPWM